MVEELLPAMVALFTEMDVNVRIVPRLDGLLDQLHPGVLWSSAAFSDVAGCAGTNYVFPDRFAAHASGDYVVERQFAGRITFAAILTSVFIAGEDVPAIKLYFVSR